MQLESGHTVHRHVDAVRKQHAQNTQSEFSSHDDTDTLALPSIPVASPVTPNPLYLHLHPPLPASAPAAARHSAGNRPPPNRYG